MRTKTVKLFGHQINILTEPYNNDTDKRTLYIKLTSQCNLSCKNKAICCNPITLSNDDVDLKYVDTYLRELIKSGCIDKVVLFGGEPLMYPYLINLFIILNKYRDKLKSICMKTNGSLINGNELLLRVCDLDYLDILLYSGDCLEHNNIISNGNNSIIDIRKTTKALSKRTTVRINVKINDKFNTKEHLDTMIHYCISNNVNKLLIESDYSHDTLILDNVNDMFEGYLMEYRECTDVGHISVYNIKGVEVIINFRNVHKVYEIENNKSYVRDFVLYQNRLICGWGHDPKIIHVERL